MCGEVGTFWLRAHDGVDGTGHVIDLVLNSPMLVETFRETAGMGVVSMPWWLARLMVVDHYGGE